MRTAPNSPAQLLSDLAADGMNALLALRDIPQPSDYPWAVLNAFGIASVIAAALRPAIELSPEANMPAFDKTIAEAATLLRKRLDPDAPAA
jgi:hypothetical protein